MSERTYEFTFMCVQSAETYKQAFAAALDYLAEQAGRQTLEPTRWEVIDE